MTSLWIKQKKHFTKHFTVPDFYKLFHTLVTLDLRFIESFLKLKGLQALFHYTYLRNKERSQQKVKNILCLLLRAMSFTYFA